MNVNFQSNSLFELKKVQQLSNELSTEIFGQDEAIRKIVDTIKIHYCGLGDDSKPIGSFLFTGPTGVGKTELAISLAKSLDMNFKRFDMSEYHSEHSVANFIGGAAGYVGYENGGILTNEVMDNPFSVLLFDEIEKADPKVMNIFLQILDYAKLTSTKGCDVSFENTIVIFTSNLGSKSVTKRTAGFSSSEYLVVENDVNDFLSPEFRARINSHIEFNLLNDSVSKLIAKKYLNKLKSKIEDNNINFEYSKNVVDAIATMSKDGLGARNIQNIISDNIKAKVSSIMLDGTLNSKQTIHLDYKENMFSFEAISKSFQNIKSSQQNLFDFATAQEAQEYAKANIGTSITRSSSGKGYIIKK